MRKTLALVVLVLALIVAPITSANAITGNAVVSDRDNVVLVTFYDEQGVYLWRCSGTLIAPTIVLTAGHCTYGAAEARVWADQGPYVETPVDEGGYPLDPVEDRPPCAGYIGWPCTGEDATGEPLTYPGFGFPGIVPDEEASFPNTGDVGLVILDTPIYPETGFASLAEAGALDVFATERGRQDVTFTVVGYGLQRTRPTGDVAVRIRLEATTQLVNLRNALTAGFNLQTTANPGGGRGRRGRNHLGRSTALNRRSPGGPAFSTRRPSTPRPLNPSTASRHRATAVSSTWSAAPAAAATFEHQRRLPLHCGVRWQTHRTARLRGRMHSSPSTMSVAQSALETPL